MQFRDLKTVDVSAREWNDKINGNSYFSAVVVLNFQQANQETIKVPFQYGYGDYYQQAAAEAIAKRFPRTKWSKKEEPLWRLREKSKTIRTNKEPNCTQKRCKELVA